MRITLTIPSLTSFACAPAYDAEVIAAVGAFGSAAYPKPIRVAQSMSLADSPALGSPRIFRVLKADAPDCCSDSSEATARVDNDGRPPMLFTPVVSGSSGLAVECVR